MKTRSQDERADVLAIYRRHVTMARQRAYRLLGAIEPAQAVTCEVFLKLLEYHQRPATQAAIAAFLYRSTTNLSLNKLREGQRQRDQAAYRGPSQSSSSRELSAIDQLRDILALVSYDEAQVGAYYFVDGLEVDEIAALLDIERQTATARLLAFASRAARLLQVTGGRRVA